MKILAMLLPYCNCLSYKHTTETLRLNMHASSPIYSWVSLFTVRFFDWLISLLMGWLIDYLITNIIPIPVSINYLHETAILKSPRIKYPTARLTMSRSVSRALAVLTGSRHSQPHPVFTHPPTQTHTHTTRRDHTAVTPSQSRATTCRLFFSKAKVKAVWRNRCADDIECHFCADAFHVVVLFPFPSVRLFC